MAPHVLTIAIISCDVRACLNTQYGFGIIERSPLFTVPGQISRHDWLRAYDLWLLRRWIESDCLMPYGLVTFNRINCLGGVIVTWACMMASLPSVPIWVRSLLDTAVHVCKSGDVCTSTVTLVSNEYW